MLIMKLSIAIRSHLASYGKAALAISSGLLRKCCKRIPFGAGRSNLLPRRASATGGGIGKAFRYSAIFLVGCSALGMQGALAQDRVKQGEQKDHRLDFPLGKITGTITSGNSGKGPSIYVMDVYYKGANANDRLPHKTCEITVGADKSSTDSKIADIKHFYMADFRRGNSQDLRGVRYRRTASQTDAENVFEAWSDRDSKAIWGMSTDRTQLIFRLEDDHGFVPDDQLQVVCKNGTTTIVSYEMGLKHLYYELPGNFSFRIKKFERIPFTGPFPGTPVDKQGYVLKARANFPRGITLTEITDPLRPEEQQFLTTGVLKFPGFSRAPNILRQRLEFSVEDYNTTWLRYGFYTAALQGATESGGTGDSDPDVTNANFSYDNEQRSNFRTGSKITETPGLNDHPYSYRDNIFYYEVPMEVRPKLDPIVDMALLGSSETPGGWVDEEVTLFMVKGREYFIELRVENHEVVRSIQRLSLFVDRTTSAGASSAATSGGGRSAGIASSNTSSVAPPIPNEADDLYPNDNHDHPGTGVDLLIMPENGRVGGISVNHFRGDSFFARYVPSETGTYRVSHSQTVRRGGFHSFDLFVWGLSSLSASNCLGNRNEYFGKGVPPEKFVFSHHVEDRVFYAREIFPSDGEGVVLQPPMESRPKYVFGVRKRVPNTERITADITLSLEGARFHQPMRSEGRVSILSPEGNPVDNISLMQVSGGNVGDKEVTFRFDNEHKGILYEGSRIEFIFPALEGVNLSRERDRVTITPTEISVLRGAFPQGGFSTCLSEVAGRGCVYARSLGIGKVALGPVDNSGRQKGTVAIVDPNDFTRLIEGGAVVPLNLPGSLLESNTPGTVNGVRLGTVSLDAEIVSSVISNSCLSQYRVDSGVYPTNQYGEPLEFEYGDNLNIGLSPEPIAAEGMFLMRKLADDGTTPVGSYQRVPAGGVFSMDVSRPENRTGNWEFFFVPSGNTDLEYGDAWTLNAGIDFLYPAYRDILSEPISRSVILDHEEDLGQPQARAYAIPPLTSPDGAFVRIRCEVRGDECQISMECANQSGQSWYGNLREFIPSGGTVVVTPPEIAQALSSTGFDPDIHWGGDAGRLSCSFYARPDNSISMQLFVRSAGTLTNNTDVYYSQ